MKYIRTKNGNILNSSRGLTSMIVTKDDILKEADAIEDLCDELVVIYKEGKKFAKPFTSVYCETRDILKEHDLTECNIYGAIWTDQGLIYVAKMNEKGELELIWHD